MMVVEELLGGDIEQLREGITLQEVTFALFHLLPLRYNYTHGFVGASYYMGYVEKKYTLSIWCTRSDDDLQYGFSGTAERIYFLFDYFLNCFVHLGHKLYYSVFVWIFGKDLF